MKVYLVKRKRNPSFNDETRWLIIAANDVELFWEIDKYLSPWDVRYYEVKKKSIFSKLGGAEAEAIDNFFKKQELDNLRNELRSAFQLYGKKGSWEALQAEIARSRAAQKAELLKLAKREQMWKDIGIASLIVIAVAGVFGIVGFVTVKAQAYSPMYMMYY